MSDLGKVIGGVLSGLADARTVADQTAKQIAIAYEADPLLRLFPVPRIEFQSVEADVPLMVHDVQVTEGTQARLGIAHEKVEAIASRLVDMTYNMLNLSRSTRSKSGLLYKELVDSYVKNIYEFAGEVTPSYTPTVMSRIEVGASATELEKAPPSAIGHLRLSAGVQNYEWVEVETRDGVVRKLVPAGR